MVSVGSRALTSRRHRTFVSAEDHLMGEDKLARNSGRKKNAMNRKAERGGHGFDGNNTHKNASGRMDGGTLNSNKKFSNNKSTSTPQSSLIRKQVDPETTKYFTEISNLFESENVDFEERSVICGNALEEAAGKEFELATDYIISHTMQSLLEGCNVNDLCNFLHGCANQFPFIAMDRSGSHVAETAIKSLAMHLQDEDVYPLVEDALTVICKEIVANSLDVMCNCHGSHVLRSLLHLCKGVPLESSEFHTRKSSTTLAERLNVKAPRFNGDHGFHIEGGFPELLKLLISGMLKGVRKDVRILQVDQYGSLVIQTILKLLVGQDDELRHIIPTLLGCSEKDVAEGSYVQISAVPDVVDLMKETAFSHLMEVILEVAPENLFDELVTKVFRNSLFELSSHPCGNFAVQALISHIKYKDQMELVWSEIGTKVRDLLEMGRSGVVASLIATSQRLQTHEQKCCEALVRAVCSTDESPKCIVPRILFIDRYFFCEDKAKWGFPSGVKMHVMGSLILQAVFRYRTALIQPYITSITSMEDNHVLEVAKDSSGSRVIEAFLNSDAPAKLKRRLIMKLRGHFGELSMQSSSSFTVEKCYNSSNLSLREAIVSELVVLRSDLSKTKQGPHLLRKLDVEGFASRPDQWRSKQASRESAYKEFHDTFGSGKSKSLSIEGFRAENSKHRSHPKDVKTTRQEIEHQTISGKPFLSMAGFKGKSEKGKHGGKLHSRSSMDIDISEGKTKTSKRKRNKDQFENTVAGKRKRKM
ncbi:pumilio homolog 23 isoform X1 [Benincasa hispida]|uniref:pumilio homolog 23 isoform X1 n=2 Tax=Benincasa hispida TaxID=102211 RepID=UPI0018FFEC7F|nr:pumilio homolog 23 isoform X1 [Benincasa hispida]XP_038898237.1 pumilio homolog 23 isoform X1 [Benincasa hispida]